MSVHLTQLNEAFRMLRRAWSFKGFKRYEGSAQEICKQIIDDCYDKEKKYFRVSTGHFCEFYVRDFAFCCEALIELGYKEKVRSTLLYALLIFRKHGSVQGSISPDGVPFTFPGAGPDSLALFLYSLAQTGNEDLISENKWFFQKEVDAFVKKYMEKRTPLPKRSGQFTSIRDQAKRKASCYDAVMIAIVARECAAAKLKFPYTELQVKDALLRNYWNGTYFFQDLQVQPIVIGDANVFPFWAKIVTDKKITEDALTAIQAAGLDVPFPLRYVSTFDRKQEKTKFHIAETFSPGYERDSIWAHLGFCYLQVLLAYNKELCKKYVQRYEELIKQHGTFLEIYDAQGEPYRVPLYITDEGMLWCTNYLSLAKKLEKK